MGRAFGGRAGGPIEFTLARAPLAPSAPRDIHFEPTDFFGYYSAANNPVLHIFPGDVVHTSTADAGGVDAKGVHHRGGDSNVGPFYVEGALPEDTLVVHLLKSAHQSPNRASGHPNECAFGYCRLSAGRKIRSLSRWGLDHPSRKRHRSTDASK